MPRIFSVAGPAQIQLATAKKAPDLFPGSGRSGPARGSTFLWRKGQLPQATCAVNSVALLTQRRHAAFWRY
jgi:hypothetical protein